MNTDFRTLVPAKVPALAKPSERLKGVDKWPSARHASPSARRRPRRRTTGSGRRNWRTALGCATSEKVLLSRRVIAAEVFSHLAPISLAAGVHPPGRQRNRPQDTQNPAHRYSLLRQHVGVNPSRYRTYHMDPHGELFGGPAWRRSAPRRPCSRPTPCKPWMRRPPPRAHPHPRAGGRGDGPRAAGGGACRRGPRARCALLPPNAALWKDVHQPPAGPAPIMDGAPSAPHVPIRAPAGAATERGRRAAASGGRERTVRSPLCHPTQPSGRFRPAHPHRGRAGCATASR